MARNLLKDDPLNQKPKREPDLMDKAAYRGVGREVPDSVSESDSTITHTHNHTNLQTPTQSHEQTHQPANTPTHDVEAMFATSPVFFTVRLPEAARDWISEEAHKRRKQKVTQQSIVADAIRDYIARRLAEEE